MRWYTSIPFHALPIGVQNPPITTGGTIIGTVLAGFTKCKLSSDSSNHPSIATLNIGNLLSTLRSTLVTFSQWYPSLSTLSCDRLYNVVCRCPEELDLTQGRPRSGTKRSDTQLVGWQGCLDLQTDYCGLVTDCQSPPSQCKRVPRWQRPCVAGW